MTRPSISSVPAGTAIVVWRENGIEKTARILWWRCPRCRHEWRRYEDDKIDCANCGLKAEP